MFRPVASKIYNSLLASIRINNTPSKYSVFRRIPSIGRIIHIFCKEIHFLRIPSGFEYTRVVFFRFFISAKA